MFAFLFGGRIAGKKLVDGEIYLVASIIAVYFVIAFFTGNANTGGSLPKAVMLPTALAVILPAILITPRVAVMLGLSLPVAAFVGGVMDVPSLIFALANGITAAYVIRGAEKRMDLVLAGLFMGLANCVAVSAILLLQRSGAGDWPACVFWAAFNGVAQGMLVLGLLPPLEKALNAATVFRLMELSDLNAPALKHLFDMAPGTYAHAQMVARLAEAAAQEIGANPLLARVGAYYHDIGKADNPQYFVENQGGEVNKHDSINPRLSATVIRSHVKLGVEKGRQLGLPQAVIDIIAEHHGNSVISWFYNEELKKDPNTNREDFSYPGQPPRSKESAVVMLADITEAATRTMKTINAVRLETFIQTLFDGKQKEGQLAASDLTFRELETIKQTFVRVLVSHYHSRIEYPGQEKEEKKEDEAEAAAAKEANLKDTTTKDAKNAPSRALRENNKGGE
jgi:putative nucleotidyltransferase with HDIG domain